MQKVLFPDLFQELLKQIPGINETQATFIAGFHSLGFLVYRGGPLTNDAIALHYNIVNDEPHVCRLMKEQGHLELDLSTVHEILYDLGFILNVRTWGSGSTVWTRNAKKVSWGNLNGVVDRIQTLPEVEIHSSRISIPDTILPDFAWIVEYSRYNGQGTWGTRGIASALRKAMAEELGIVECGSQGIFSVTAT